MPDSSSKFSASEQGLGYIFQPRLALLHALDCPEDDLVFIEGNDDVEFVEQDGKVSLRSLKHKPARLPPSTSAFFTHSCSVCAEQPILAAIDDTAPQREKCSTSCSVTIRTARARTSGENLFVVLPVVGPTSPELGSPANPGRFNKPKAVYFHQEQRDVRNANRSGNNFRFCEGGSP